MTFVTTAYGQKSNKAKPFVLGVVEELHSTVLAENRILNIYLPPGYAPHDTVHYPVIYLLDGSADEDFIHVVGLVQFNSFEWVNHIPKSIVVGVATVDRRRDFTFPTTLEEEKRSFPSSGHSDKFIDFLEKELHPYIGKKYKANSSRTIIGQSFGGLLASEILVKKPALFTHYIIVSPSLWWDNGSLLKSKMETRAALTPQANVYIGVGKEGLAPSSCPSVMEVDAHLLADKVKQTAGKDMTVFFEYLPQENHATILHQAVSNAFKLLYPRAGAAAAQD